MLQIYKIEACQIQKNYHGWVKDIISKETGLLVEKLSFHYGEHGKPMLTEEVLERIGNFDFNLSHSGDYLVLAVSDKPVGIDIEHIRKDRISVAKRFFCREEYEELLFLTGEERDRRFLEYWTMKEAYVKRIGTGSSTPFNSFLIKRLDNGLSVVEKEAIYFKTWFLNEEYCISVCSENTEEYEFIK